MPIKKVMDESDVIVVIVSEEIKMGCEYIATTSDMWLSIFLT